jgi:hypothetical protein
MSAGLATLAELDEAARAQWAPDWQNASSPPKTGLAVKLWVYKGGGEFDHENGWWDGAAWRLTEGGGLCPHMVSHWALPEPTL